MPLGLEAGRTNHPYSFDLAEDFEGMKFRVPELLLGCLLTVAVLSIGLTLSSSFHHVVATAQAETVDERLARYTGWLAVLTAGLVAASLIQFYFLGRAEKTSQALANLAREEFVATHRPRIIVRFLQGPFHNDEGHEFYWLTLANVGETAATVTEIGADLARRNIESRNWTIPGLDASPKPVSPIVLESGQRHTTTITAKRPVSDVDMFGDATGTFELCAVGLVRYEDRNGRRRETAFFRTNRGGEGFEASTNKEEEYED
jgi:hypothetical protein